MARQGRGLPPAPGGGRHRRRCARASNAARRGAHRRSRPDPRQNRLRSPQGRWWRVSVTTLSLLDEALAVGIVGRFIVLDDDPNITTELTTLYDELTQLVGGQRAVAIWIRACELDDQRKASR